jgi:hypothetical protein
MGLDARLPTLLYGNNTAAEEKEMKTRWLNFFKDGYGYKGLFCQRR